jgi:nitrite reductase/ring-hydroxylating ferredoxin subunit
MSDITRKGFLKLTKNLIAALGIGAVGVPVVAFFFPAELEETPSDPVAVGKFDDLPEGKSKTVPFGRYPAIVVNTPEGIKAYSAVCTHFACITKWDESLGQIVCPCHEGYFDPLDGSVISGPPPSPLQALEVEIDNGTIFISAGGEV